jgi:hypothetical protein
LCFRSHFNAQWSVLTKNRDPPAKYCLKAFKPCSSANSSPSVGKYLSSARFKVREE